MFEALNTWVNLGEFKPKYAARSIAIGFVFHHIRPVE
jgi:hypothetical protein